MKPQIDLKITAILMALFIFVVSGCQSATPQVEQATITIEAPTPTSEPNATPEPTGTAPVRDTAMPTETAPAITNTSIILPEAKLMNQLSGSLTNLATRVYF